MNDGESGAAPVQGWHQQDILAELRKRGTTISAISRDHGLSSNTMRTGFYRRYPKAHRIIAQVLEVPVHELWPQWYEKDGSLKPLQGARFGRVA